MRVWRSARLGNTPWPFGAFRKTPRTGARSPRTSRPLCPASTVREAPALCELRDHLNRGSRWRLCGGASECIDCCEFSDIDLSRADGVSACARCALAGPVAKVFVGRSYGDYLEDTARRNALQCA